jgi:hypothetical protein
VAANRVLAAVRKMFAWAASRDIIALSPCIGVSPLTGEKSRDRVLGDNELRLVWRAADAIGWPFGPIKGLEYRIVQHHRASQHVGRTWRNHPIRKKKSS